MQAAGERERYLSDFRRFAARKNRREPSWLGPIREAAISRFAEIGFPTLREEDWKYTNVSRLVSVPFKPVFELAEDHAPALAVESGLLGEEALARLVFVNGRLARDLSAVGSLPSGVRIESLAEALAADGDLLGPELARHASIDRSGFTALSTAFLEDGAFVLLPDGVALDEPIELVFVSTAGGAEVVAHPRILVVCGKASRGMLVESYVSRGQGATLTNAVAEIVLDDGAALAHVRVVGEGARAAQVATTEVVQQGRDSRYASSALALGGAFLRHNLNVRLAAEGAECSLDGLYLAAAEQFVDNHTAIDHALPHGTSRELYKGVLAGKARAVFNGKVLVRPDAQKSDAQQTNKNLLLSEHAEIDTKPELQIFADDVKCAHGAAIGQLDPDALFYLKSRGIDEATGRRMLIRGFVSEVIQRIPVAELRAVLEEQVTRRLERDLVEER